MRATFYENYIKIERGKFEKLITAGKMLFLDRIRTSNPFEQPKNGKKDDLQGIWLEPRTFRVQNFSSTTALQWQLLKKATYI